MSSLPCLCGRRPVANGLVLLATLAACFVISAPARGGVPLTDVGTIFFCSHDGSEALGSSDQFATPTAGDPNDLRYWEYDEATGAGTTTPYPAAALGGSYGNYVGICFPKDGARLVYLTLRYVDSEDYVAVAWDVEAGTVTRIDSDFEAVCCSDDGSILYGSGAIVVLGTSNVEYRTFKSEKTGPAYVTSMLVPDDGTIKSDYPLCCSADGRFLYGYANEFDPSESVGRDQYLYVYDDSIPRLTLDSLDARGYSPPTGTACAPDGQTVAFISQSGTGIDLVFGNPEFDYVAFDLSDAAFVLAGVSDDGIVYGDGAEPGEPYRAVYLERSFGAVVDLPTPESFVRGSVVSATPNAERIVYRSFVVGDSVPRLLRFTRASGVLENLKDVLAEENLAEVYLASRDATRFYGRAGGLTSIEFLVEIPADDEPPTVESATVSVDGLTLTLVFSETVTDILPPTLNFTRGAVSATYESGDGTHAVKYALSRTIEKDETGTYDLAAGAVQDAADNSNESASGSVVNRSKVVVDRTPPKVVSAKINAAGDTLTIVYSENVVHRRNPTLELSGGRVAARYESGTGSRAIAYDLSRDVRQGETGKYRLVEGAVVDAAGNRIEVASGPVQNGSTSREDDDDDDGDGDDDGGGGSHVRIKIDKRPNGSYANYYCDAAYQHASGIISEPNGYTSYGYYAFLNAYYSTLYRYKCGDRIRYDGSTHLTRAKALAIYKSRRRMQMLYAYYVQTYAYEEYKQTSSTSSLYAYLYAYYSYVYASRDLKAK